MKHTLPITFILLALFMLAQFLGLFIIYQYIDQEKSALEGRTIFKEIPFIERPEVEEKTFFIPVIITILIGTGLFLLLIKYKLVVLLKLWFFIAISLALLVALQAFIPLAAALAVAVPAALWRIIRPNIWTQNISEIFIYGGMAAIFVPLFNLFSGIILLILIAGYDAYAVWKSKHMITLAKSQAKAHLFAGLLIPYSVNKTNFISKTKNKFSGRQKIKLTKIKSTKNIRTAILGGGDIGFPLIFAGIVLKEIGLWQSLTIPFFAAAALGLLFWKADHEKFYPAMPFISAGCLIGLGVVWIIGLV